MSERVHQLAKELGITSKDLIEKLNSMNIEVKGHMSVLDDATVKKLKHESDDAKDKKKKKTPQGEAVKRDKPVKKQAVVKQPVEKPKMVVATKPEEKKEPVVPAKPKDQVPVKHAVQKPAILPKPVTAQKTVVVPSAHVQQKPVEVKKADVTGAAPMLRKIEVEFPVSVKQLSLKLGIKPSELITLLMKRGVFANINQNLEDETANEIAKKYGYEITKAKTLEEQLTKEEDDAVSKTGMIARSPVVTFMGHVDHGKTSLLDYIRKTRVAAKEKGGITQHIGAYQVKLPKGSVTFLDTPGHEAFTAMRARGANATDIVVLVVAADDGVMPQTKEAIDHAKAAGVTIVVAINKCDLPNISIDKIKRQLAELDLMCEDWGGKTIHVPVSAKTGQGVDQLLEMLVLESELLELKANPSLRARGVVIEAKLSQGKGIVASILVKNGTLRVGDTIVSGLYYGKVKAMMDYLGNRIVAAPPSTPVEILGLQGVPEAGDDFFVTKDEKKARLLSSLKLEEKRQKELKKASRMSLEHLYDQIKQGEIKELRIVLKADVQGSIEALHKSLEELSTEDVKLKIVHSGVGAINESDIMLAVVTNAVIIGFHVKTDPKADEVAKKENIEVKRYDIIYEAIEDIKAGMEGLLEPILKETFQGRAKVQQVFTVTKVGTAAGCIIVKGNIARSHSVRVLRGDKELFKGKLHSLKRFKDDVKEVTDGMECGMSFERFNDIKAGDLIESFLVEKVARRLNKSS